MDGSTHAPGTGHYAFTTPSCISATAGEAVYPPERQRILGERAKRTQRLQRAAARRGAPLRLAYSLAMAGCFLMMAASGAVAGGP